jgi:hypothetical protein
MGVGCRQFGERGRHSLAIATGMAILSVGYFSNSVGQTPVLADPAHFSYNTVSLGEWNSSQEGSRGLPGLGNER